MRALVADLDRRVARMTFGDVAERVRTLHDDHQLQKAIEMLQRSATQAQLLARVAGAQ
jgi:hypothetical protein